MADYGSQSGDAGAYSGADGAAPEANPENADGGAIAAVAGARDAGKDDVQKKLDEAEANACKKSWEEYEQACNFDKDARQQFAIDRRYAAGTADKTWAVSTNLIGSFIDILVSFLYARDPEVSARKAPQVDNSGTKQADDFAKTAELVVTRLWKKSGLKKVAKKTVRSVLSTGEGWFKAVMIADKPNNPEMDNELNDLRNNIEALEAVQESLKNIEGASTETTDAELAKQNELIESLQNKIEATIRKYMAIDFIPTQNMQVSVDVCATEDYLDADWNANHIFVPKCQLLEKFPRLTEADIKNVACYYQRPVKSPAPMGDSSTNSVGGPGTVNAEDADNYVKGSNSTGSASEKGPEFAKVVEKWDKRTDHIHTMIEGLKKWAKEPYEPNYACSRFYPYFRLSFFEIDGQRHPQSLSGRLSKLMDEYCSSRSSMRLTRERSIPGVMFDNSEIDKDDANKISNGEHAEMIGISPTTKDKPLGDCFAAKPTSPVDFRLFDNQPILADMEKVAGVQEALQSSVSTPKTATEAGIQQSGFASRTTADRDSLEDVLDDFANYTLEVALGALGVKDAQRIAGAAAFWPFGMAVDDLVTMVEIEIKAGTTGKPKDEAARQAWGVILPVLKEAMIEIQSAQMTGNEPLAKALSELVKETMVRMGDDTDPDRFIPAAPQAPILPGAMPGAPNGGAPPPGGPGSPSLPPGGPAPAGPGALSPPDLQNPTLQAPSP